MATLEKQIIYLKNEAKNTERILLEKVLQAPEAWNVVKNKGIEKSDFNILTYSTIFEAIKELKKEKVNNIDKVALYEKLRKKGVKVEITALNSFFSQKSEALSIGKCCDLIKEFKAKIRLLESLLGVVKNVDTASVETISSALESSTDLLKNENTFDNRLLSISQADKSSSGVVAKTGFNRIDKFLNGFTAGSLVVISGETGAGKSAFLDHVILNNIEVGTKTLLYSGELTLSTISKRILRVASDEDDLIKEESPFGSTVFYPNERAEKEIEDWLESKFFVYNNDLSNDLDLFASTIESAVEREGVKLVIVDNLMTLQIKGNLENRNNIQFKIVNTLKELAKRLNIAIFLVAHNRKKTDGENRNPSYFDIAGASEIANLADVILNLTRDEERLKIAITKSRNSGILLNDIILNFDPIRKRYWEVADFELNKSFNYKKKIEQITFN